MTYTDEQLSYFISIIANSPSEMNNVTQKKNEILF